jgi:hypothetical protein
LFIQFIKNVICYLAGRGFDQKPCLIDEGHYSRERLHRAGGSTGTTEIEEGRVQITGIGAGKIFLANNVKLLLVLLLENREISNAAFVSLGMPDARLPCGFE